MAEMKARLGFIPEEEIMDPAYWISSEISNLLGLTNRKNINLLIMQDRKSAWTKLSLATYLA